MIDTTQTEIFGEKTKTDLMEQIKTDVAEEECLTEMSVHPVPLSERVIPIKYIRIACLALAVIGIPLLYMAALFSRPHEVKIEQIGGSMQSALVQITGTMVRDAKVIQRAQGIGEITLYLDDGTGVMTVEAYKGVARDLVLHDKLPRMGDVVEVAGIVRADTFGDFNLNLVKTSSLNILEQELPRKSLLQVRQESFRGAINGRVTVESVQHPGKHSNRPWRFTVTDGTASMDLIIWNTIIEPSLPLAWGPGAVLEGRLAVSSFRGSTQLSISRLKDLSLVRAGAEIRPVFTAQEENAEGR